MVAVRTDIAETDRGTGADLLFDFECPRGDRRSVEIGLRPAGRDLRTGGQRSAGNDLQTGDRDVLQRLGGVERRCLVQPIVEIVEQRAIDAETRMQYGAAF